MPGVYCRRRGDKFWRAGDLLCVLRLTVRAPSWLVMPKGAVKESQADGGYDEGEHK
jgi:hypothetical protein